jgi:hypothetical protein
MDNVYAEYGMLLDRFLSGAMTVEEFQVTYLDRFKTEERPLDEPLYQLLDELFGDVDAFGTDPKLFVEHPDFYLDENGLREKVRRAAARLLTLNR